MNNSEMGVLIAIAKTVPDSALADCETERQAAEAAQTAAEAAAERAETAADTVTSATVAETKSYLGIS